MKYNPLVTVVIPNYNKGKLLERAVNSVINQRYSSFDSGDGKAFEEGNLTLENLYEIAQKNGELPLKSGKQELLENIINQYI